MISADKHYLFRLRQQITQTTLNINITHEQLKVTRRKPFKPSRICNANLQVITIHV
jgi:hypothetical protein